MTVSTKQIANKFNEDDPRLTRGLIAPYKPFPFPSLALAVN